MAEATYTNHLDSEEPRWFAVNTRYKREKIVRRLLEQKGIEVFLPINRVTRQWGRKRKTVELPLISCYIFVKIKQPEYIKVLETENVLTFVRFSRNLVSIPDTEISILKRIIGEVQDIEVEKNTFQTGDIVEVASGNLTGLKGRLIEVENDKKFVIELENLGYSLQVQIDESLLRRVN